METKNILFRSKEWWSIGSSASFFLVALVAFWAGEFVYAVLAAALFAFAFLFHITKPRGPVYWDGKRQTFLQIFWLYADSGASIVFGAYSAYLLFTKSSFEEIIVVTLGFFVAFYLYWRASKWYEIEHTLWHVIISILAIIILI